MKTFIHKLWHDNSGEGESLLFIGLVIICFLLAGGSCGSTKTEKQRQQENIWSAEFEHQQRLKEIERALGK
jgi:ABC-type cobalt transport system substrate-binding protein